MKIPTNTFLAWRARLSIGLALICLAMIAGCGNDLSQAEDATTTSNPERPRTTEVTGAETTTTASDGADSTGGSTDGGATTGITLPDGSNLTLPDGTELTLPEGVDLTIPDGLGDCVEAGAALTELSLGALGVSSTDDIDQLADTLRDAFGPGSSKDIDIVAEVARDAAEDDQINPGAAANKAYTQALESLTGRLAEVCGVGN